MRDLVASYEELIRDLCRCAGIEGADEVVRTQHVQYGDKLIGLIPEDTPDGLILAVYIEVGQTWPDHDSSLYERMLTANVTASPDLPGHYGLHPTSHQAVYCMRFDLEGMQGDRLASLLDAGVRCSLEGIVPAASPLFF
jgi:hypothetical protein